MTMEDEVDNEKLLKLKSLAQAATPGPWKIVSSDNPDDGIALITTDERIAEPKVEIAAIDYVSVDYSNEFVDEQRANAQYIAAANPCAILELISRIEELEKEREEG